MTHMNCTEALPLVWSYLDGELSETQAQGLRKHLLDCHACRNHAQEGKTLKRWFIRSEAAEAAPPGFSSRVARAAFATRHAQLATSSAAVDEPAPFEEGRVLRFVLRCTAVAAVLLFVLSLTLRFQSLPATNNVHADTQKQLDDTQVRELLERLNADDAAKQTASKPQDSKRH